MDNPFGLQRYGTADLESLMDRISRNSIGLDTYFENIFNVTNQVNYPPYNICLLYTSPSPRDVEESRMPSSA